MAGNTQHAIPALRAGHHLHLLEGSRAFFPALVAAIDAASHEVLLETYIFDVTGSGADVAYALERAARRGLVVKLLMDGFGTPELPPFWQMRFDSAHVRWTLYSPPGRFGLLWPGQWRRLHRKLCVVDGTTGFCGGINILDDFHDPNFGTLAAPRLDFALSVQGPLVALMHDTMRRQWSRIEAMGQLRKSSWSGAFGNWREGRRRPAPAPKPAVRPDVSDARAALLLRDNLHNRRVIERAYLRGIGRARSEIIIANAYFVPGGRLRRALANAARRGVQVHLLLQGRYEYFMQYYASRPVFSALLRAGVHIHEYAPSFLHAKVAVIDGRRATVGSSNLDPLSLLLAREANLIVDDVGLAKRLRERLVAAMEQDGQRMDPATFAQRSLWQRAMERLALIVMRVLLLIQGKKYL